MKKRQKPKQWYEDRIKELYEGLNNLNLRLQGVEMALTMYIDMNKHRKKFEKFIEKKNKENEQSREKEQTSKPLP
jgi:hypothetical protein